MVLSLTQTDIDNIATNLDLRYKVDDNIANSRTFTAALKLTNKGNIPITKGPWFVYFCSIRQIITSRTEALRFQHINGCVHKFYPTDDFINLDPDSTLTVKIVADHWVVARTDVMPNWYVTSPGYKAKTIESTKGEGLSFVEPFLTKEQWKRYTSDRYDPYTAEVRYDTVEIDSVEEKEVPILIPQPVSIEGLDKESRITIDKEWKVYADSAVKKEAEALASK